MKHPLTYLIAAGLLGACSMAPSTPKFSNHPTWQRIPSWAQKRVQSQWWRKFGDASLNQRITSSLSNNPGLAVVAARLQKAEAQLRGSTAQMKPHINLGIGRQDRRKQDVDFGPYDLSPWQGGARLAWQIDLTGKLLAASRSARFARDAAFWDVHAARLELTSRVASAHFTLNELNGTLRLLKQNEQASAKLVGVVQSQANAGIIPATQVSEQRAKHAQSQRAVIELQRMRDITLVQLRTLCGGAVSGSQQSNHLPSGSFPSQLNTRQILASHPTLLAAEARVRSAFQLEKSAKLNLLPSFSINASALGAGSSLTGRYKTWQHRMGASLDIPIYDPSRLAKLAERKAEKSAAAAQYRSAVLKVLGEIDSARINYSNRRRQLNVTQSGTASLKRAYQDAQSQLSAGLTNEAVLLRAQQRWIASQIDERKLRRQVLLDSIQFYLALGGG